MTRIPTTWGFSDLVFKTGINHLNSIEGEKVLTSPPRIPPASEKPA
jgi:hypothetical protein